MASLIRFGFLLMMFCGAQVAMADSYRYSDGMVRAAVIFGILRFTEWPDATQPDESMNLCAMGLSPSSEAISSFKKIPSIGQTKIRFIPEYTLGSESDCHALIIGPGKINPSSLPDTALLICDQCESSAKAFSAIGLLLKEDRVQFDINLDVVQKQNISLSASLIELAARCTSSNPAIRGCDD